MKTIEERAKELSIIDDDGWRVRDPNIEAACTQIANEVVDKACEIYRKELSEIISTFNHLGKRLYDIDELGELISLEGSVNDFRKAMKGE